MKTSNHITLNKDPVLDSTSLHQALHSSLKWLYFGQMEKIATELLRLFQKRKGIYFEQRAPAIMFLHVLVLVLGKVQAPIVMLKPSLPQCTCRRNSLQSGVCALQLCKRCSGRSAINPFPPEEAPWLLLSWARAILGVWGRWMAQVKQRHQAVWQKNYDSWLQRWKRSMS